MSFILSVLLFAWAILCALLQASGSPLKNWISPGLTVLSGLLVLIGALVDNVSSGQAIPLGVALPILAGSDFAFERSEDPFALWGIALFFCDSLVGLRAFPNPERPIRWLSPNHLLFAIITIYYTAQYALVSWAL